LKIPGDQVVAESAGSPIILVKGDDGKIGGFYNICRHRSGPLATENCNSRVLQCKYHGWTYLLDGSLRGTPRFNRTELFDKKDFGLFPISISEWEGMIFAAPAPPLVAVREMAENISKRILPEKLSTKKLLANLLDLQEYVTETSEWYSLQYSPLKENDTVYGSGQAFYYFIFPNFMLNILPGRLQTNLVLPVSHNQTLVIFQYYYDDVSSPAAQKLIEEEFASTSRKGWSRALMIAAGSP
jgi:choline monooxygenase